MKRWRAIVGAWLAIASGPMMMRAAPALMRTAAGQFEIASTEASAGERALREAETAWRLLAGPLDLPAAFSSAIFVRLVPADEWTEIAPFVVTAEPGGVVSARVRWSPATPELFLRRALVQALLLRSAVAEHGVTEKLTVPLWLEVACVGWWRTHEDPAQLDALQQESATLAPPALDGLLRWQRSDVELRTLSVGAVWLLSWLQAESGRSGAWSALRSRLLGGAAPAAALAACFPGKFSDGGDRELWWQTGWHHARRQSTQPQRGSAESRGLIVDAARFVFAVGGQDTVVPLRFVLLRRDEAAVAAVLAERAAEWRRTLPGLHPFYRNAGIALADCFAAKRQSDDEITAMCFEFERAWREATELEAAAREALDAVVRTQGARRG